MIRCVESVDVMMVIYDRVTLGCMVESDDEA